MYINSGTAAYDLPLFGVKNQTHSLFALSHALSPGGVSAAARQKTPAAEAGAAAPPPKPATADASYKNWVQDISGYQRAAQTAIADSSTVSKDREENVIMATAPASAQITSTDDPKSDQPAEAEAEQPNAWDLFTQRVVTTFDHLVEDITAEFDQISDPGKDA